MGLHTFGGAGYTFGEASCQLPPTSATLTNVLLGGSGNRVYL